MPTSTAVTRPPAQAFRGRRRFRLPVAGSLRYWLIVAHLAGCMLLAGGVLWLGQRVSPARAPLRGVVPRRVA